MAFNAFWEWEKLRARLRGMNDAELRMDFDKYDARAAELHADLIGEAAAAAGPGSKDKDTERRMSKAGLASFMRDKGLEDAEAGRVLTRVDANSEGEIDFGEFRTLARANSDLERVLP
jgi:hypothetical protein